VDLSSSQKPISEQGTKIFNFYFWSLTVIDGKGIARGGVGFNGRKYHPGRESDLPAFFISLPCTRRTRQGGEMIRA
jgi:hypothetical protein